MEARTCDPENPTDGLCGLACGGSTTERQLLYQEFLYHYLRDALLAPSVPSEPATYAVTLDEAAAAGAIVRTPLGSDRSVRGRQLRINRQPVANPG